MFSLFVIPFCLGVLALLVISVIVLILARWFIGIDASHRILTLCIMGAMLCGTVLCEQEVPKSALSFTVLTTGMVYIGWLGGYMISLRQLPNGMVKFLLVLALIFRNRLKTVVKSLVNVRKEGKKK